MMRAWIVVTLAACGDRQDPGPARGADHRPVHVEGQATRRMKAITDRYTECKTSTLGSGSASP